MCSYTAALPCLVLYPFRRVWPKSTGHEWSNHDAMPKNILTEITRQSDEGKLSTLPLNFPGPGCPLGFIVDNAIRQYDRCHVFPYLATKKRLISST